MTDAREALRDKIIQRHLLNPGAELLDTAIDLVLEQAEKAIKETKTKSRAIAAIRALKSKTGSAT